MAGKRVSILNPFQRILGTLFACFIIAVLMGVAAHTYMPYRETAKLCQVIGGATFTKMRLDMMVSHALRGDWPKNDQEALKDGWAEEYFSDRYNSLIKAAAIEDGAIHFQIRLNENQGNGTLTMRPAVPAKDPLGPVVWICGRPVSPSLWSLPGVDRTDMNDRYIPLSWR
jgi:hypothetical protein